MAYPSILDVFLIIFLLPFCALAQNYGTVPVGSRMAAEEASNPWRSPSGDFAFGFRQTENKELFLLSIWYSNIPDRTIAWFLNSIDPAPRGSTLVLNAESGLVLRGPQGPPLWSSEGIVNGVDHGFKNDTGNFILVGSDFVSLWETFRLAADTILPLQQLVPGDELISRRSETNFSRGRFYLRFLQSGNLVLNTRSLPTNSEYDAEEKKENE